jgi:hypothetical protein
MPLASLDLRQNKSLTVAITAAIAAYLEQEGQAVPIAIPTVPVVKPILVPEPSVWRVLRYMIFKR